MTIAQRLLRLVLRVTGAALLLAAPFVFVPRTWHAAIHERLGFGPYPDGPVIDYLVRSVSAMYVLSGLFCWLVTTDLRRYGPTIIFLGAASVAFGILMTAVDALLGLPWWWLAGEGPPAVVLGVILILLERAANRPATDGPAAPE
ncbi:MAG: hypothetical protein ISS74_07265 [Planctomycetes bacterium]|nr:hypothetical protein [Planctomycetota bacterium]